MGQTVHLKAQYNTGCHSNLLSWQFQTASGALSVVLRSRETGRQAGRQADREGEGGVGGGGGGRRDGVEAGWRERRPECVGRSGGHTTQRPPSTGLACCDRTGRASRGGPTNHAPGPSLALLQVEGEHSPLEKGKRSAHAHTHTHTHK